ncbi:MAG: hypothetical protein WCJ95_21655 [Mariniphaga sp.]
MARKIVEKILTGTRWFIEPRLSTLEFEECKIRCGSDFSIEVMNFDDFDHFYPHKVTGRVWESDGVGIEVAWNKYGEATVDGKCTRCYDVVREKVVQKEIDGVRIVFCCLLGLFLIVAYLIINRL